MFISEFLPFGIASGDELFSGALDGSSSPQNKVDFSGVPCPFLGINETILHVSIALAGALVAMPTWVRPPTLFPLQVNTHGQLSFRTPFLNFTPVAFPFGFEVLIAPFWNDIDVTDTAPGQLFFRLSNDDTLLGVVGATINAAFVTDFSPLALFIATWDGVHHNGDDRDVCSIGTTCI